MSEIEKIETEKAPAAIGHYSQGIVQNGVVYVSGQVAKSAATGDRVPDSVGAQTELALRNVEAVLTAAGSDLRHVLKMTVFISGMEHWAEVNAAYARVLGDHKPARAIIPVGDFGNGLKIEIEAIAAVKTSA